MRKKKEIPGPYAALTKDTRFAGTYEVLVPDSERGAQVRFLRFRCFGIYMRNRICVPIMLMSPGRVRPSFCRIP